MEIALDCLQSLKVGLDWSEYGGAFIAKFYYIVNKKQL